MMKTEPGRMGIPHVNPAFEQSRTENITAEGLDANSDVGYIPRSLIPTAALLSTGKSETFES
jgi:hypothetical protein